MLWILPHWRTRHGPGEHARCCRGCGQVASARAGGTVWKKRHGIWFGDLNQTFVCRYFHTYDEISTYHGLLIGWWCITTAIHISTYHGLSGNMIILWEPWTVENRLWGWQTNLLVDTYMSYDNLCSSQLILYLSLSGVPTSVNDWWRRHPKATVSGYLGLILVKSLTMLCKWDVWGNH